MASTLSQCSILFTLGLILWNYVPLYQAHAGLVNVCAVVLTLLGGFILRHRKLSTCLLGLTVILLSAQTSIVWQKKQSNALRLTQHFKGTEHIYTLVAKKPDYRSGRPKAEAVLLCIDCLNLSRHRLKFLLHLENKGIRINDGDTIQARMIFRKIPGPRNPDVFDRQAFYSAKAIQLETYIEKTVSLRACSTDPGSSGIIPGLRKYCQSTIGRMRMEENARALVKAMLLGDRSTLDYDLSQSFSNAGAIHVLAVSGLHTGIIFTIVSGLFYIFNCFWFIRWIRAITLILSLLVFAGVCYYPPSAIRAAFMLTVWILLKTQGRTASAYDILSLTACVVLLVDPGQLWQMGFQFSYLAIFGILFFYKRMQWPFKMPGNKLLRTIWSLVSVSLAAQLMVLPFILYYFGRFPVYFWLSSLVAVPLCYTLMFCSIAAIALGTFSALPASLLDRLCQVFYRAMQWIEQLPYSLADGIFISKMTLALLCLVITLMVYSLAHRLKRPALTALLVLGFLLPLTAMERVMHRSIPRIELYHLHKRSLAKFYFNGTEHTLYSSDAEAEYDWLLERRRQKLGIHTEAGKVGRLPASISSGTVRLILAKSGQLIDWSRVDRQRFTILFIHKAHPDDLRSIPADVRIAELILDGSVTYDNRRKIHRMYEGSATLVHDTHTEGFWHKSIDYEN